VLQVALASSIHRLKVLSKLPHVPNVEESFAFHDPSLIVLTSRYIPGLCSALLLSVSPKYGQSLASKLC